MTLWEKKRQRIIENYPKFPTYILARMVNVPLSMVVRVAISNNLKKDQAALKAYREQHPNGTRDAILDEYPMIPTDELSRKYRRNIDKVYKMAENYGVEKDYNAMRTYLQSRRPDPSKIRSKQRSELVWEYIYAYYPDHTYKKLSEIYGIPEATIISRVKKLGLKKDIVSRISLMKSKSKDYPTRPTREIAAEIGTREDSVRRYANRHGLHKQTPWKNTRRPCTKQRLILAFANTSTVEAIAEKVGCSIGYTRFIIRNAGLKPIIEKKHKRVILQWSKDGQIVARYPSCLAASKALGKHSGHALIRVCIKNKAGNRTAYGFRWTEEIINP